MYQGLGERGGGLAANGTGSPWWHMKECWKYAELMVAQRSACARYLFTSRIKLRWFMLCYVNFTSTKRNPKTVAQAQTRDKDPSCTQSLEKLPTFQGLVGTQAHVRVHLPGDICSLSTSPELSPFEAPGKRGLCEEPDERLCPLGSRLGEAGPLPAGALGLSGHPAAAAGALQTRCPSRSLAVLGGAVQVLAQGGSDTWGELDTLTGKARGWPLCPGAVCAPSGRGASRGSVTVRKSSSWPSIH